MLLRIMGGAMVYLGIGVVMYDPGITFANAFGDPIVPTLFLLLGIHFFTAGPIFEFKGWSEELTDEEYP
jgi:hypothetical protein